MQLFCDTCNKVEHFFESRVKTPGIYKSKNGCVKNLTFFADMNWANEERFAIQDLIDKYKFKKAELTREIIEIKMLTILIKRK
jgi:uncharacterized FlgJ-related protein